MTAAAFLLAGAIGLLLGALGGGGSILVVPALVYGLAADPKQAVAMSLPIVALSSVAAATSYWRTREVDLRWSLKFGLFAMTGAFLGAKVGVLLPPEVQLTLLALVILAAATSMLRSRETISWHAMPAELAVRRAAPEPAFGVSLSCRR